MADVGFKCSFIWPWHPRCPLDSPTSCQCPSQQMAMACLPFWLRPCAISASPLSSSSSSFLSDMVNTYCVPGAGWGAFVDLSPTVLCGSWKTGTSSCASESLRLLAQCRGCGSNSTPVISSLHHNRSEGTGLPTAFLYTPSPQLKAKPQLFHN